MSTARYKKVGNLVYGLPFKDGTIGVRIVRDYVRIFHNEPVIRTRKLSAREKVEAVL